MAQVWPLTVCITGREASLLTAPLVARRTYWSISSSCQQGAGAFFHVLCILKGGLGSIALLPSMANSVIVSPKCLFSFSPFSWCKQNTALCILSMSFCNTSLPSPLVLVHLAWNWCFIWSLLTVCLAFWARNYFFFLSAEKKVTIFRKQFPQIWEPNWFYDSETKWKKNFFFLLCKFLIFLQKKYMNNCVHMSVWKKDRTM